MNTDKVLCNYTLVTRKTERFCTRKIRNILKFYGIVIDLPSHFLVSELNAYPLKHWSGRHVPGVRHV